MNDSLSRLANNAAADPFFLAFALAEYAAAEGLDEAGLAAVLGCPADRLPLVRLCRTPGADPERFREEVEQIAEAFGLNREALAAAVRHGQVVAAMREASGRNPDDAGLLIAARDRAPS